MRVEELRLNNYVYSGVRMVKVKSIHTDSVLKDEVSIYIELNENLRHYRVSMDDIEPIELTEEILLKCGFEQKYHLFRLHLVNSIYIEFNSECNLWYFDIYMNTSRIELQYLHELQNIYSSITFKELEINL